MKINFYILIILSLTLFSCFNVGNLYTLHKKVEYIDPRLDSKVRNGTGKNIEFINGYYYYSSGIKLYRKASGASNWSEDKIKTGYSYVRDIYNDGVDNNLYLLVSDITKSALIRYDVVANTQTVVSTKNEQAIKILSDVGASASNANFLALTYNTSNANYSLYKGSDFNTKITGIDPKKEVLNIVAHGAGTAFYLVTDSKLYTSGAIDGAYTEMTFSSYVRKDGSTANFSLSNLRYIYSGRFLGANTDLILLNSSEVYRLDVTGTTVNVTSNQLLTGYNKSLRNIFPLRGGHVLGSNVGFYEYTVKGNYIEGKDVDTLITKSSYFSSDFKYSPLLFIRQVNGEWFLSSSSQGLWRLKTDSDGSRFFRE